MSSKLPERQQPNHQDNREYSALTPQEIKRIKGLNEVAEKQERKNRNLRKFTEENLKDETPKPPAKPPYTPEELQTHYDRLWEKLQPTMLADQKARAEELEADRDILREELGSGSKSSREGRFGFPPNYGANPQPDSGDGGKEKTRPGPFDQPDDNNSGDAPKHRNIVDDPGDYAYQPPYGQGSDAYSKVVEASNSQKAQNYSEVYEQSDDEKLEAVNRVNRRLNGQEIKDPRLNDDQRKKFKNILVRTLVISRINNAQELPKQAKDLLEYMAKEKSGGIMTDDEHAKAKQDYTKLRDIMRVEQNSAQMAQMRREMESNQERDDRKRKQEDEERPNSVDDKGQRVKKGRYSGPVSNEPFDESALRQQRSGSVNDMLRKKLTKPEDKENHSKT